MIQRRRNVLRAAVWATFESLEQRRLLAGEGVLGQYFYNIDFTGATAYRHDQQIDFYWSQEELHDTIQNNGSVRWTGKLVVPTAGQYTFFAHTDDGVRLWINDVQIIDDWVEGASERTSSVITLPAGQVNLKMEYFDTVMSATAKLRWQGPGISKEIVPNANLLPGYDPSVPSGWSNSDIGAVGAAGSTDYHPASGTFTVRGSGADIYGTADEFQFVRTTMTGDGEIIAHLTGYDYTDDWNKVGLMLRESDAANSRFVGLFSTRHGGIAHYRSTTGGSVSSQGSGLISGNNLHHGVYWLKIARSGDTFTLSRATNPQFTSAEVRTITLTGLPATLLAGLAVTSHNDGVVHVATFDNVTVTGEPAQPPSQAPAITSVIATHSAKSVTLNFTDGNTDESEFIVSRKQGTGGTWVDLPTPAPANASSYVDSDPNLLAGTQYFYRIRAANSAGSGPYSTEASLTTPTVPIAPTGLAATLINDSQVDLDWNFGGSTATGFVLDRSQSSSMSPTEGTQTVGLTPTEASDTGWTTPLQPSTTYYYRVRATNAWGTSTGSFAGPVTTPAAVQFVYLSDLNPTSVTNPYFTYKKDKSVGGNTLTIGGQTYSKGLGMHSHSEIVYTLNGEYDTFTAIVGIDDEEGNGSGDGSAQWLVYVDNEPTPRYTSPRRTGADGPYALPDIDISGATTIKLVTNTGGQSGDNDYKDHANWAEAKVITALPASPTSINISGSANANEGSAYTLHLSATGPQVDDVASWTIDWGDGTAGEVVEGADPGSVTHVFADGPDSHVITATAVTTPATGSQVYVANNVAVTVNNVAPTITQPLDRTFNLGDTIGVTALFEDPGTDDVHTATVNWGDGTSGSADISQEAGSAWAGHTFAILGTHTVTFTVTDDDGASDTASFTATVIDTPPTAPTNLGVSGEAWIDGVTFTWEDATDDEDVYLIEWSDDGSEWFVIDEVEGGETSYTDEYPTFGQQFYRITSWLGEVITSSATSSAIAVTPKAPPVAWYDDNAGANERGTLSPYHVVHDDPGGVEINVVPNDIDYDSSTVYIPPGGFTQPENGTVTLDVQTGAFTYVPDPGYVGTDTFTYWVVDGDGTPSAPATVAVDVTNVLPVPQPAKITYDGQAQASFLGQTYEWGHIGQLHATDDDDDALAYEIVDDVSHGTLVIDPATGQFVYTPDSEGFPGVDRFTFTASDGVDIAAEDRPIASVVITAGWIPVAWSGYDTRWSFPLYTSDPSMPTDPVRFISLPSNGYLAVWVPDGQGGAIEQTAQTDVWYPSLTWIYHPDDPNASFEWQDRFTYVWKRGPFTSKPATVVIGPWKGLSHFSYPVSNTENATYSLSNYLWMHDVWGTVQTPAQTEEGFTLELGESALRGTVVINPDRTFTYTPPDPDPQTGELYFGWDFFSFKTSSPERPEVEHWVQLQVGDYPPPPPPLPVLPNWMRHVSAQPVAATYEGLQEGLAHAKNILRQAATGLAAMGQIVGNVAALADDPESTSDEVLDAIDAANPEVIAAIYDEYMGQLAGLSKAMGKYLANRSYYAAWYHANRDSELFYKINKLPLTLGSLRASKVRMEEMSQALEQQGEGAGIAVNMANRTVEFAETAHTVLTTAQMAGGVTVLVQTGVTLATKQGFSACAKLAAKTAVGWGASATAATVANFSMEYLDIDEDTAHWMRVGLDAYQIFSFFKLRAAQARMNSGACFVAGTNVITAVNADGTLGTKRIEDLKVGDFILSRDQHDPLDDLTPRKVTQVFQRTSDHLRILTIEGDNGNVETIKTTDEHPFYVKDKGWTSAGSLQGGDLVQETDGTWQTILASERESHPDGITVYNLEVEGSHTYFVEDGFGAMDAVWVHNAYPGAPKPIQSTGHVLSARTKKILAKNLGTDEHKIGPALEDLKDDAFLDNDYHGKIWDNGDFTSRDGSKLWGNIANYLL